MDLGGDSEYVRRVSLNRDEVSLINEIFTLEPVVKTCTEIIESRIFSEGVRVVGSMHRNPKPEFSDFISKYFTDFAKEAFRQILQYGLVVYAVRETMLEKRFRTKNYVKAKVPIVIPYFLVNVEYGVRNDGTRVVRAEMIGSTRSDKKTQLHVYVHKFPDIATGNHNSRVSALVSNYNFMRSVYDYTLVAEHVRSHPSVVLKHSNTDGRTQKSERSFFSEQVVLDREVKTSNRRAAMGVNQVAKMKVDSESVNEGGDREYSVNPQNGRVINLRQLHSDNLFLLPPGFELDRSSTLPAARADYTNLVHLSATTVCGVFSIPKTLVFNESSARSGNNSIDENTMIITLQNYEKNVLACLKSVYSVVYDDEPDAEVEFALSEKNINSVELLLKCWEYGVIDDNVLKRRMARMVGLSQDEVSVNTSIMDIQLTLNGKMNQSNNMGNSSKKRKVDD